MPKPKNIVVIGGGTGVYTVLSGLKKYPHNLTAIVSMADDGGSTGILREEFGILPPGDARRALVALSNAEESLAELFNYRFEKGGLRGHNFGNLLITVFERLTGDFEKAIEGAGKLLSIRGQVIPVTLDNARLYAELENGEIIKGETNIDIPKHNPELKIKQVLLKPRARANSRAVESILRADLIIIGPGDLYTSVVPNLLVDGIPQALKKSKAKKVYVCNLMTKYGETNAFRAKDFTDELERYLGRDIVDFVVLNKKMPPQKRIDSYWEEDRAVPVMYSPGDFNDVNFKLLEENLVRPKGLVRHDADKLSSLLVSLI